MAPPETIEAITQLGDSRARERPRRTVAGNRRSEQDAITKTRRERGHKGSFNGDFTHDANPEQHEC